VPNAQTTPQDALAIEQHIPALRRYARALVRDGDRADDLVQDCLERGIARIDQFRPGTNLRTWLFTILHNLHCDNLRRQNRRGVHVPIDDWMETAQTGAEQPRAMHLRDFRRALRGLPASDRQILLLIGVEGFTYEEAAEVLGVAIGTVKSRLFRARDRLKTRQIAMNTPNAGSSGAREAARATATAG
jgi:RNA polymerase sigma-70 factor (ECF subfamily)